MQRRCDDPEDPGWPRYGGRGIRVADEWVGEDGFERFYAHVGPRPTDGTLDRIHNDGNYEPGNVRWASRLVQARNRSTTMVRDGELLCLPGSNLALQPDLLTPDSFVLPPEKQPALMYLARLAKGSRPRMKSALDRIADIIRGGADAKTMPWHLIRHQHAAIVRTRLVDDDVPPNTANLMLSALRGVIHESWRLGHINSDERAKAVDVKNVRGSRIERGHHATAEELTALLGGHEESTIGKRDRALIAIAFGCGMRRAEIVGLDLCDIDLRSGRNDVIVRGKGNKERQLPLSTSIVRILNEWIALRGGSPGPLFFAVTKTGRIDRSHRLSTKAVFRVLEKHCNRAGIIHIRPHDLRRTYMGSLLTSGIDISTVQKLAGHANVATTVRYDRRGEDVKRAAIDKLDPFFDSIERAAKTMRERNRIEAQETGNMAPRVPK